MAGQYEKAITIKQAIDSINLRHYLLPAIQRKFVWSSSQICLLFDSIMRDYPINSFMMWDIRSASIKNDYKFYEFLGNDSNLLIVFYVQIMPNDFVMQLHRF